jgi:hypothetical protein
VIYITRFDFAGFLIRAGQNDEKGAQFSSSVEEDCE